MQQDLKQSKIIFKAISVLIPNKEFSCLIKIYIKIYTKWEIYDPNNSFNLYTSMLFCNFFSKNKTKEKCFSVAYLLFMKIAVFQLFFFFLQKFFSLLKKYFSVDFPLEDHEKFIFSKFCS